MQLQIGWINQSWNSTSSIKQLYHWIPYSINLEFSKLLSTIGIQAISTFRSLDQALVTNINWVQLFEVAGWPTLGALRSNEKYNLQKQKNMAQTREIHTWLFEVTQWSTLGAFCSNENLQKQKDGLKSQRNTPSIVWAQTVVNSSCTRFQFAEPVVSPEFEDKKILLLKSSGKG